VIKLVDQVIERRLEELKNADELSWTQAAVNSNKETDDQTTPDVALSTIQTDPQLEEKWKLVKASGNDPMALKPKSRLQVDDAPGKVSSIGSTKPQASLALSGPPDCSKAIALTPRLVWKWSVQNTSITYRFTDNKICLPAAAGRPVAARSAISNIGSSSGNADR